MADTYSEQLAHGIVLPSRLIPEVEICQHGGKLDNYHKFNSCT